MVRQFIGRIEILGSEMYNDGCCPLECCVWNVNQPSHVFLDMFDSMETQRRGYNEENKGNSNIKREQNKRKEKKHFFDFPTK